MGSYQILGGSRPFPKEIRPRGATGLVQQVEAMLGRDSTACSTGCTVISDATAMQALNWTKAGW